MKLSSLSILIPAYKDEKTITTVIKHAIEAGKKAAVSFEIVAINDASPDATGVLLDGLKKTTSRLRVIHHTKNMGYSETMKELYLSGKKQWLFTAPGDYQIDPMEIMSLVPFVRDADMIIGWRRDRKDTMKRRVQSYIYNVCVRLLFGVKFHDMNSARLMKRTFLQGISIDASSAFVDAKMTLDGMKNGQHVIEAPITHRPRRTEGASGGKMSIIIPVIRQMIIYAFLKK